MRKGKHSSVFSRLLAMIKLVFVAACVYLGVMGIKQFDYDHAFPFNKVKVYGINEITQDELKNTILPFMQHGFFAINIEALHDKITQNPWVSHVVVKRKWPDELQITLTERQPVANWNHHALLSGNGELFTPSSQSHYKDLPLLVGPPNQHVVMLRYLQNINRLLNPIHVRIRQLDLNAYATWKLTLDNGIVLYVGYKDVLARINQFVKVYSTLQSTEKGTIASVDLRYPNGMAVKWAEREQLEELS